ncbi:YbaK/aminoacyl-tRNA synthetase-associated domain [Zea mays]|uniref:YbaK/aminoacyl-tRNA synthetase-associated domain n=1 Tax=Zea mays TaxID=4577 RepID=A0A1D6QDZ3_MAIZE|nr:YbaK/aminoacyl-tRNA synthetase-associated domain [Zea mays]
MGYTKDQLLAHLQKLKIDFTCYDHPVVLTVEEQAKHVGHLGGALSKNLLLKDKKHRLYVISALAGTKVDMKILSQRLGLGKGGLRMAPEENLLEVLQVPLGCVTPFALINESASAVSLLLDQGFKSKQSCYFHPLTNDVTIGMKLNWFIEIIVIPLRSAPLVRHLVRVLSPLELLGLTLPRQAYHNPLFYQGLGHPMLRQHMQN